MANPIRALYSATTLCDEANEISKNILEEYRNKPPLRNHEQVNETLIKIQDLARHQRESKMAIRGYQDHQNPEEREVMINCVLETMKNRRTEMRRCITRIRRWDPQHIFRIYF